MRNNSESTDGREESGEGCRRWTATLSMRNKVLHGNRKLLYDINSYWVELRDRAALNTSKPEPLKWIWMMYKASESTRVTWTNCLIVQSDQVILGVTGPVTVVDPGLKSSVCLLCDVNNKQWTTLTESKRIHCILSVLLLRLLLLLIKRLHTRRYFKRERVVLLAQMLTSLERLGGKSPWVLPWFRSVLTDAH